MGRYNFTALRVRRHALQALDAGQITTRPVWVDVIGDIPPAQIFVRKQPQEHHIYRQRVKTIRAPSDTPRLPDDSLPPPETRVEITTRRTRGPRAKKSKLFKPMEMRYEEDGLRQRFYKDHPWELARPRIVLENDGRDAERADWGTGIEQHQKGKKLDGESVVQRQLYLLQTVPNISLAQSYDIARREFYSSRQQEDIERRIAAEEARYLGVSFAPDVVTWGMALEDDAYNDWEQWSRQQVLEREQRRAAFTGENTNAPLELAETEADDEEDGTGNVVRPEEDVKELVTERGEERNVR